jgi:hypothetical protein
MLQINEKLKDYVHYGALEDVFEDRHIKKGRRKPA